MFSHKKISGLRFYLSLLLLLLVLFFFFYLGSSLSGSNHSEEKELLQKALDRSITQCYALEGAYPQSLDYLTDHYGLSYNTKRYFIDYQYIGANLRPDTTIIEKD